MRNAHAEICRRRAEECRILAERSPEHWVREKFLKLADDWTKLANDVEKCASVPETKQLLSG
jgi:hypothetical protein